MSDDQAAGAEPQPKPPGRRRPRLRGQMKFVLKEKPLVTERPADPPPAPPSEQVTPVPPPAK